MTDSFFSLAAKPPNGFQAKSPGKYDLLKGYVAIHADSVDDAISLLADFTERVRGIIITPSEKFNYTPLGPALWNIGIPDYMLADLGNISAGFLEMLFLGQSAMNENEQLKIELANSQEARGELTDNYNANVNRLSQKVEQLHREMEKSKQAEKALLTQKENLRTTLNSIGDAVIATDRDGIVTRMNPIAENLTGWPKEEALGKPLTEIFNIINAQTRALVENPVDKVIRKSEIVGLANHTILISRDGCEHQIADSAAPIRDADKNFTGVVLVFRDVTEEYTMQMKLEKSEESLKKAQEIAKVGSWEWDLEKDIINISDGMMQIYGINNTNQKLSGSKDILDSFIHKEDRELVKNAKQKLAQKKSSGFLEYRIIREDNNEVRWIMASDPVIEKRFGHSFAFGTIQDITEHKQVEDNLRESEEKFRTLAETMPVGVLLYQGDKWIYANPEVSKVTGYSNNEILKMNFWDFVAPEFKEKVKYLGVKRQKNELAEEQYEFKIITKGGKEKWVFLNGSSIKYKGEFAGLISTIDITDRKQAEKAIVESEAKLRKLFEKSSEAIFIVNHKTGKYVDANTAAEKLTGRPLAELKTQTTKDVTPTGAITRLQLIDDSSSSINMGEVVYVRPDGSKRTALLNAVPINDTFSFGIAVDITERLKIEKALRESEKKYRLLSDNAMDTIWTTDLEFNITYVNNAITKFLGYTPEELLTLNSIHFTAPESLPILKEAAEKLLAKYKQGVRGHEIVEVKQNKKDGTSIDVEISANLNINDLGEIIGFQGRSNDITLRKRAKEEKEKLQKQLTQAQKMESVGRLAGGVAHDFNNMLSVIVGYAQMMLQKLSSDDKNYDKIMEIKKAGDRSANLTKQLLAFARKQTISPEILDLNSAIENMLKMLMRLIGEDINLLWKPVDTIWKIKMDPGQIDQMLANLCVNARDAIKGVGKIIIETENKSLDSNYCINHPEFIPGDYVLLTVSDNGSGMDKETLTKIFEPFFTTKKSGEGTGLGLATIYGIVKQNNGYVNVYSELGHGTSFSIYLPKHEDKKQTETKDKSPDSSEKGSGTILLVEDEPAILKMTTDMIKEAGYKVLPAKTPGEAIIIAQDYAESIDMLMTDVIMPEMNGRDLAKRIILLHPNIKRLFMSGYTADVIAHHGVLDKGINFIQKPFAIDAVKKKLQQILKNDKS